MLKSSNYHACLRCFCLLCFLLLFPRGQEAFFFVFAMTLRLRDQWNSNT